MRWDTRNVVNGSRQTGNVNEMAKLNNNVKKRIGLVGKKIQALRLARNMSIEDLGKKTSVSSVTISNIEKGIYSPKLSTVLEIAKALDTTILYLIEDVDGPSVFKIEKDRQRLKTRNGIVLHDFSPVMLDRSVQVAIMEMDKDTITVEHDSFDGNEFVHVLKGHIIVDIEDERYELDEGDSLYFHGSYQHSLKADVDSKIIFLTTFN